MEGGRVEAGSSLSRVVEIEVGPLSKSHPPINRKQTRSLLCPLPYETLPSFVERREESRHTSVQSVHWDWLGL